MNPPERPSDQETRDRVTREIDRCCVVEAGAGTGKTTLLVDRALQILASGRATLDQIAVITFTEKAAGELKVRLRRQIEKRLAGGTAEGGAIFRQALEMIDRAAISTIHSFAASLLRERPVEAALDPRFAIFDDLQAGLILDEAFDRFWMRSLTAGDPDLEPSLRLGVAPRRIRSLALEAARNRDLAPPPRPPEPEPPQGPIERFRARVEALRALLPHCTRPDDKALQQILRLVRLLRGLTGLEPEAARLRILLEGSVSLTAGKQENWEPRSALKEAKTLFKEIEDDRAAGLAVLGAGLAWRLAGWLDRYRREYAATLEAKGGLDFQGLLIEARDLLRDRPDVRADFQKRYRYLLVDEFQDTDPLQTEIVFFLAAAPRPGAADWREVRPADGRLFVVGDPKQSIYRFRRADIAVYETARRLIAADDPRGQEVIRVNFRTVPSVIDWVNGVFARLMAPGDAPGRQPAYAPITGHRRDDGGGPGVIILPLPPGAEARTGSADQARDVEAALLTSCIRRIVTEDRWTVQPREGQPRPARWGDVALLFRGLTGLERFERALRAREIPYRVIGGKAFYARQETRQLQAVLRAVDNPHDALSVAAALRSPLFGCSDEDLFLHVAGPAAGRFDYLRDAGGQPPGSAVGDAFRLLRELHLKRNDRPPADTVEEILDRTGILALRLLGAQGDQRIANLLKVADLARRHEAAGDGGFRSFVRFLSAMEEDERQEAESPTVEEDDDVVRLMTVHKAKGLEFPIVALADAGGRPGTGGGFFPDREHGVFHFSLSIDGSDETFGTWGYEKAKEVEKAFTDAEQVRLLYVAATRARDYLIVPVVSHEGKFFSFLKLLREAGALPPAGPDATLEGWRVIDTTRLEIATPRVEPSRLGDGLIDDALQPDSRLLAERSAWKEGLHAAIREAARGLPIRTATGPERETRPEATGSASKPRAAPRARRQAIGVAVHAVLERFPPVGALPAQARLDAAVSAADLETSLNAVESRVVARLVRAAFASPLAARLARARRIETEYPFAVMLGGDGPGRTLLEGRIDLLFEEPDGCVIVDYKTDAVPAGPERERVLGEKAGHYRPQAAAYAVALAALGIGVKSVVLSFLDAAHEHPFAVDQAFLDLGLEAVLTEPPTPG
jgi:ATP-dependent exoDNAse (exonuclease V) beta subunit